MVQSKTKVLGATDECFIILYGSGIAIGLTVGKSTSVMLWIGHYCQSVLLGNNKIQYTKVSPRTLVWDCTNALKANVTVIEARLDYGLVKWFCQAGMQGLQFYTLWLWRLAFWCSLEESVLHPLDPKTISIPLRFWLTEVTLKTLGMVYI